MYSPQRNIGHEKSLLGKTSRYSSIRKPFKSSCPIRDSLWRSSTTKRSTNDDPLGNITLDEFMTHKRKKAKVTPSSTSKSTAKSTHIPKPTARKSIVNSRRASPFVHDKTPVYKTATQLQKAPILSTGHPSTKSNVSSRTARYKPTTILSRPTTVNNAGTSTRATIDNTASSSSVISDVKIRVCVRKRPLTKEEVKLNEQDVAPLSSSKTIEIHAPK
jgi:hypothetical protein